MSSSTPVALPQPSSGQPCSCGTGKLFDECCGPLLSGESKAATAEQLMRSRFTAHVARDYGYLHRTYFTSSQEPYVEEGPTPANAWTRLTIHSHTLGASPDLAFVEFSAFYVHEDGEAALQEKSEFRRVEGDWFYIRALRLGPAPFKSTAPKAGRNDPCPCGSGKKYKHCCLNKAA